MRLLFIFLSGCLLLACNNSSTDASSGAQKQDDNLAKLFDNYWEQRMKLFPLDATQNGDYRYNDRMEISFTDSFRDTLRQFYTSYLNEIKKFDPETLEANDRIS